MKKFFTILALLLMCSTIFVGCGSIPKEELKYSLPHNTNIPLNAAKEEIIEKDKLFQQALDPYQTIYTKSGTVSIGGIEFSAPKYFLNDKEGLTTVLYISMGDAKNKYEKLNNYFKQIYYDNGEQSFYFVTFDTGEKYEIKLSYYLTSINPSGIGVEVSRNYK